MITSSGTGPAAEQYSGDDEDQLSAEDTLIERGADDLLDEGYSPPEQPWRGAFGSSRGADWILAAEEPDPTARLDNVLDESESERLTMPNATRNSPSTLRSATRGQAD